MKLSFKVLSGDFTKMTVFFFNLLFSEANHPCVPNLQFKDIISNKTFKTDVTRTEPGIVRMARTFNTKT